MAVDGTDILEGRSLTTLSSSPYENLLNPLLKERCLFFLFLSAFGPYIYNIRTDQIMVLILDLICIGILSIKINSIHRYIAFSFIVLLFALLIILFGDKIVSPEARVTGITSVVWRFSTPIQLLFCFIILFKRIKIRDASKYFEWILILSFISATLSLLSKYGLYNFFLKYYARGGEIGVWNASYSLGRYMGVFNQPLEAGVFYSTALFIVAFLWSTNRLSFPKVLFYSIGVFVGGLLSLSKMFILVGVALSILLTFLLNRKKGIVYATTIVVGFTIIFIYFLQKINQAYLNSFITLASEGNLISALTAGRFGGDSYSVQKMFKEVVEVSPIFGMGIGTRLPLDNGYLEFFYQGGIVALFLYILMFFQQIVLSIRFRQKPEAKLLFILALFALVASTGGPVITANRSCIFYIFAVFASMKCLL